MKRYLFSILIITLVIIIFQHVYIKTKAPYKRVEELVSSFSTETDVINTLGNPYKIAYKGDKDYYVQGYSYKKKYITNKVYIYFPKLPSNDYLDIILYIYFDEKGRVESFFVGGS